MIKISFVITKQQVDLDLQPVDDAEGVKRTIIINTDAELAEWEIIDMLNREVESCLKLFLGETFNYVIPRLP